MKNFMASGFFDGPTDPSRMNFREIFENQPSQAMAKEVVRFSPARDANAALIEADRKIAAGESLFELPSA